jgi:hypothetical protein
MTVRTVQGMAPYPGQARCSARPNPELADASSASSDAIIPELRDHLAAFVNDEFEALVFPGQMGGPRRETSTRCPAGRMPCGQSAWTAGTSRPETRR